MLYSLIRSVFFSMDAESAHHLGMQGMKTAQRLGLLGLLAHTVPDKPRNVMGIDFPNPVGLAAGLDKNGDYIDALAALGFGFLEIGTITPRPQPGNPKPRLFRIPEANAIINRMGFNNDGVDKLIENVRKAKYSGILGINIGKNFDTPIENAADDYLTCLRKVYPHASYVTVNISSPNTKNLRQLQQSSELEALLDALKNEQGKLAQQHGRHVPLALKIAPDLETEQIIEIADLLLKYQIEGVIATNTTLAREGVAGLPHGEEAGGLSGAPVRLRSTSVVKQLSLALDGKIPIIGVGGIMSGLDAKEKILAGASLVQFYSGFIYRGPALIKEACEEI
ncbi:MAG: quinone-dependent dihydroorotate dehydrogenase [Gammaproteobacteria bacterium]|nr:quinone-dependent dihydroorotate dehydrogenase [Gammaproteobacteria bacterium]MBU1731945.1 quinone-dependent dihydroorotate dehydrogenase [Gammaproteobacteria bacterium]MBU1893083.1 quinone-dependent dihydroorotate dehydrogenase [Gammaproteobacteria bacterium]